MYAGGLYVTAPIQWECHIWWDMVRGFQRRIHHRGSSLPSLDTHPSHIKCKEVTPYFEAMKDPNPNLQVGALVGGPDISDAYDDNRPPFWNSEAATYINAPFVCVLSYFTDYIEKSTGKWGYVILLLNFFIDRKWEPLS